MARPKKIVNKEVVPGPAVDTTPVVEAAVAPAETAPIESVVPDVILPEADRLEMDRYFRVINTSNQARRISQAISHQRELQMWGIHQYDDNPSRNSFARSFYFKDRNNAVKALDYANKLLA